MACLSWIGTVRLDGIETPISDTLGPVGSPHYTYLWSGQVAALLAETILTRLYHRSGAYLAQRWEGATAAA